MQSIGHTAARAAPSPEPRFALVVIAASAGGIPALREILSLLPKDFRLPLIVVQHRSQGRDFLPEVLRMRALAALDASTQ